MSLAVFIHIRPVDVPVRVIYKNWRVEESEPLDFDASISEADGLTVSPCTGKNLNTSIEFVDAQDFDTKTLFVVDVLSTKIYLSDFCRFDVGDFAWSLANEEVLNHVDFLNLLLSCCSRRGRG